MLSRLVSRAVVARPAASASTPVLASMSTSMSMSTSASSAASSATASTSSASTPTHPSKELITYLTLSNISDNPGAIKKKRRIGRGIGSSKGKTSGRGHKGQKARAGRGVHPSFEGGQTKLYKRLPKRGFTNVHGEDMVPVNVGTIQDYIDMGRLRVPSSDNGEEKEAPPLTIKDLVDAGITNSTSVKHGIKLLGKGRHRLRSPIRLEVSRASAKAIAAIESVGGSVTTVHYNRLALRALLKPEKFDDTTTIDDHEDEDDDEEDGDGIGVGKRKIVPRRARPPPKLMPYYTSYDKRGYLAPEVQLKRIEERLGKVSVADDDDTSK
mmetsp:Transcript_11239/g.23657  ORF Transcript_11239/g.23657 Transcript_11239/m.23657 type:complete len:325 (-) Transcript_11239:145-1119(-)